MEIHIVLWMLLNGLLDDLTLKGRRVISLLALWISSESFMEQGSEQWKMDS
jgi:hypothetical protein